MKKFATALTVAGVIALSSTSANAQGNGGLAGLLGGAGGLSTGAIISGVIIGGIFIGAITSDNKNTPSTPNT